MDEVVETGTQTMSKTVGGIRGSRAGDQALPGSSLACGESRVAEPPSAPRAQQLELYAGLLRGRLTGCGKDPAQPCSAK